MAQVTSGFRAIFSNPGVYNLAQRMVGAERARRILVHDYFSDMRGKRMLDIGCGTAEILRHLPEDMDYSGFDASEAYIVEARHRFSARGSFRAELVREATLEDIGMFDLVLAFGLLHHLDDDEAAALFRLAAKALKPNGCLITVDPVYTDVQSRLTHWVISKDRGQNVRNAGQYASLAKVFFPEVQEHVRDDLLHIPYTHLIMQCAANGT